MPFYFINLWLITYRHRYCTYLYYSPHNRYPLLTRTNSSLKLLPQKRRRSNSLAHAPCAHTRATSYISQRHTPSTLTRAPTPALLLASTSSPSSVTLVLLSRSSSLSLSLYLLLPPLYFLLSLPFLRPAPPHLPSITYPEACSSDSDLQLHCKLHSRPAQMVSWLGQFGTGATGATTRRQ